MLNLASVDTKSVNDYDAMRQKPCKNITSQKLQHNLQPNSKRSSHFTFQPIEANQTCLSNSVYVPSTLIEGSNDLYHVHKKPRLDIRPQNFRSQQQAIQQPWQQGTRAQSENYNSVPDETIYQQKLQFQQSVLGMQQARLQQQCQQPNHRIQRQSMQKVPAAKESYDGDVYTPRLMEYMCHQRNRPPDNNIAYWRKFVEDNYAPKARKMSCFSLCNDVEDCDPGVRADEVTRPWPCAFCGSKSGRSSEAVFENFPSLFQSEFGSGILDEMLSLDLLHEPRLYDGITIVEYGRAVLHRICRESRVVHEGLLHVAFTQDLKILSWQFCTRRHEEFVPLRLLKPMVNNVVKLSEYCQNLDAVNDSEGKPEQRLQATRHMLEHVYLIHKTLEPLWEKELQIPRTYFQGIELSYSADNKGNLTNYRQQYKQGPIASSQNYPQPFHAVKLPKQKIQEMELLQSSAQGHPTKLNMPHNSTSMCSGLNTLIKSFPVDVSGGLVGNWPETGHGTPGTHESAISMEPVLSWTTGWEPISDNVYQICSSDEVQSNPTSQFRSHNY